MEKIVVYKINNRTMPACSIIPEIMYRDFAGAVNWLCDVLGFEIRWIAGVHRAQLSFGNSTIAVTEKKV